MNKAIKKDTSAEVPLETTSTEIVAQDNNNFNLEKLISQGIEKGLTVDTMERLLAMRKDLKAEWAKEQFNTAMAGFQAECPTIQKTKEVKDTYGKVLYSYAPIESIVNQIKGLLQKHGFSYSTSMEVLPDGVKVCVKTIHTAGHTEESCMQVPLGTKTGIMSASQQTAAAQTFAKRYAFLNAFGILTGDEDNDGADIKPATQVTRNFKQAMGPGFSEEETRVQRIIKDLDECATQEEVKQRVDDIKIAKENGKLSEINYEMVLKVARKVYSKLMPKDDSLLKIAENIEF